MADLNTDSLKIPFIEKVIDEKGLFSAAWQGFLRQIKSLLDPFGSENIFALNNNQTSAVDIVGLRFNSSQVSQACVDYLIQRVTTGTGAMELIDSGTFWVSYLPGANKWLIRGYNKIKAGATDAFTADSSDVCTMVHHGFSLGDIANVTTSGSLPGGLLTTKNYYVVPLSVDTFKLAETLENALKGMCVDITSTGSGTHKINSMPGVYLTISTAGQVKYTSTNITGVASISRIAWRARTIEAKSKLYSKMAGGGGGR